jgi:hypothetical protein
MDPSLSTKTKPIPDLEPALHALSQIETAAALAHLESALHVLADLTTHLESGGPLNPEQQRATERELLRFQQQLRAAGQLTRQGLAFCREWTHSLVPPGDSYGAAGQSTPSELTLHSVQVDG